MPTHLDPFKALPLIRSFMSVDVADGMVYRVEVRRDPVTGMTLMQRSPA